MYPQGADKQASAILPSTMLLSHESRTKICLALHSKNKVQHNKTQALNDATLSVCHPQGVGVGVTAPPTHSHRCPTLHQPRQPAAAPLVSSFKLQHKTISSHNALQCRKMTCPCQLWRRACRPSEGYTMPPHPKRCACQSSCPLAVAQDTTKIPQAPAPAAPAAACAGHPRPAVCASRCLESRVHTAAWRLAGTQQPWQHLAMHTPRCLQRPSKQQQQKPRATGGTC